MSAEADGGEISFGDVRGAVDALFKRKRMLAFAIPLIVIAYLGYVLTSFDIVGVIASAKSDNAVTLVADSYSYKTHVTRDNRSSQFVVAIEGEKKGTYADGTGPYWVKLAGDKTVVDLEDGYLVKFDGALVKFTIPGYGVIEAKPTRRQVETKLPDGEVPSWINVSRTRLSVTTPNGRLAVTKARTVVYRYTFGWELFWFTLDSDFYGKSFPELVGLAVSGERLNPERSNFAGMVSDFWTNKMWRHSDVAWAIFETILIAFLGTIGAAIVALPLAFLSARNFAPTKGVLMMFRRLFDFLRGVDALIWTIVLARAFGPGPMTGALAILLTDTGSFGKLFSEALENVDKKHIEAMDSVGASRIQRYRFGVFPQISPILLSQLLYYLESNIRSATIVGAIVGGGIGLLLTQAIITQKDWEEVSYYIVLIIIMVFVIDSISAWLRRRLIVGKEDPLS